MSLIQVLNVVLNNLDDSCFPKVRDMLVINKMEKDEMAKAEVKDCCYEDMTKTVGGQSQPQPYHDEPMRNSYENTRKGYDVNGLDQSGMKGKK